MDLELLKSELTYKAVRSSGSGGQNVNKVATKVELYFKILESQVLNDIQKQKLSEYLSKRITKSDVLILSCGETRSQFKNKTIVTQRFLNLIKEGLKEEKERRKTKVPRSVIRKRLSSKRKNSEKKTNRKAPSLD